MKKMLLILALVLLLAACAKPTPLPPQVIIVTATPEPTAEPTVVLPTVNPGRDSGLTFAGRPLFYGGTYTPARYTTDEGCQEEWNAMEVPAGQESSYASSIWEDARPMPNTRGEYLKICIYEGWRWD